MIAVVGVIPDVEGIMDDPRTVAWTLAADVVLVKVVVEFVDAEVTELDGACLPIVRLL